MIADKQQELDIPSFKIDENEGSHKEKENQKNAGKTRPMTQITGVRKLKHTNSFTGQVPKYGVETPHKEELGKVTELLMKATIVVKLVVTNALVLCELQKLHLPSLSAVRLH